MPEETAYADIERLSKLLLKETGRQSVVDIDRVRALLEAGASPAWKESRPVTDAVNAGNIDLVRLLFQYKDKGSPHFLDAPLWQAIQKTKPTEPGSNVREIAKLLIEAGAVGDYRVMGHVIGNRDRELVDLLLAAPDKFEGMKLGMVIEGTNKNWIVQHAEASGDSGILQSVRDALARYKESKQPAPPPADPRDQRITDLERHIRELSADMTALRGEMKELKAQLPATLDKPKLAAPSLKKEIT